MEAQFRTTFTMARMRRVESESGIKRSTIYQRVAEGLWTKPVKLGPRAVGWPLHEVEAMNAARIAGQSDDDIRALVSKLEMARGSATRDAMRHDGAR